MTTEGWNQTLPSMWQPCKGVLGGSFSLTWSRLISHCSGNLVQRGPSHKVSVLFFSFKNLSLLTTIQWIIAHSSRAGGGGHEEIKQGKEEWAEMIKDHLETGKLHIILLVLSFFFLHLVFLNSGLIGTDELWQGSHMQHFCGFVDEEMRNRTR